MPFRGSSRLRPSSQSVEGDGELQPHQADHIADAVDNILKPFQPHFTKMSSSHPTWVGGNFGVGELSKIRVARWSLKFMSGTKEVSDIERQFQSANAKRYLTSLRVTTVLFLLVNMALTAFDATRFDWDRERNSFLLALALRFAVILPTCVAIVLFTFTSRYIAQPPLVGVGIFIIGVATVVYSVVGRDPGYGTLSLLVVYMYR